MEIAMSAVISQKKGWVVTQEAFERMLAELHPDVERAGEEYEKIRRKLIQFTGQPLITANHVRAGGVALRQGLAGAHIYGLRANPPLRR
jgi:hypothetical protein